MISLLGKSKTGSHWAISSDDLPDPQIIRRAPLLAGLENNPVYRLIVWRRRIAPQRAGGILFSVLLDSILIVGVLYFAGNHEMFQWQISPAILMGLVSGFIFDHWPTGYRLWRRKKRLRFFNLPPLLVTDLLDAGTDPVEIALGVWGSGCPSRAELRRSRLIYVSIALFSSILMVIPSIPLIIGLMLRIMAWGAAFKVAIFKHEPAWALSVRAGDLTRWDGRPTRWNDYTYHAIWLMLAIEYPIIRIINLIPCMHYLEWVFWFSGGWLGATLVGRMVSRSQSANFDGLQRDARRMFLRIQEARDPDPAWEI